MFLKQIKHSKSSTNQLTGFIKGEGCFIITKEQILHILIISHGKTKYYKMESTVTYEKYVK